MAGISIQWDTVHGAEISADTSETTFTRTGLASGIATKDPADDRALINALIAAIRKTPRQAPGTIGTWITSLLIKPVAATDQARISVTWKGASAVPQSGVRWVIEDDSTLAQEQEEIDLNGKVIQAIYQPPGKQGVVTTGPHLSSGYDYPTIAHTGKVPVLRPRRQIRVSGYVIGPPGASVLATEGTVNEYPWPQQSLFAGDEPKPKGYWLVTNTSAHTEQPRGFANPFDPRQIIYKVSATFTTKIFRDWASYVLWRNERGNIPKDLGSDAEAKKRKAIIQKPYGTDQIIGNGFTKVGMYELRNLRAVYGF